jgi:hypothetical protein
VAAVSHGAGNGDLGGGKVLKRKKQVTEATMAVYIGMLRCVGNWAERTKLDLAHKIRVSVPSKKIYLDFCVLSFFFICYMKIL